MALTSFGSYKLRPSKFTGLLRVGLIIAKSGLLNSIHSETMIASPNNGNFHTRKSFKFEGSSLGSVTVMIKTWLAVMRGSDFAGDIFKLAVNWVLFCDGSYPVSSPLSVNIQITAQFDLFIFALVDVWRPCTTTPAYS